MHLRCYFGSAIEIDCLRSGDFGIFKSIVRCDLDEPGAMVRFLWKRFQLHAVPYTRLANERNAESVTDVNRGQFSRRMFSACIAFENARMRTNE